MGRFVVIAKMRARDLTSPAETPVETSVEKRRYGKQVGKPVGKLVENPVETWNFAVSGHDS